jgi:hypothetical protein
VNATFRVTGKQAELWHAETGKIEDASYTSADSQTTVPLRLGPWGTVFVIFRKPARASVRKLPLVLDQPVATVDGPWEVSFEPDRGAPPSIKLDTLQSWTTNADLGVKYFSGIGTYSKNVEATPGWFKADSRIWIDLGDVKNLAIVKVNGKTLGTLWHSPYRVDATDALRPGNNELTISVTNTWVNRMIGDQQTGAQTKYTFTVIHPYAADSALLPSGLLGPVRILTTSNH